MTEFVFEAELSVHAVDEAEAGRLAREARDFLNDPVLFGRVFDGGGDIAPPELRLVKDTPSARRPPGAGPR